MRRITPGQARRMTDEEIKAHLFHSRRLGYEPQRRCPECVEAEERGLLVRVVLTPRTMAFPEDVVGIEV